MQTKFGSRLHGGAKKPKMKKVLGDGPKKVANHGGHSMGSTIGQGGMKAKPVGSDQSKVKGTMGKFNGRKYSLVRRAIFGLGRSK